MINPLFLVGGAALAILAALAGSAKASTSKPGTSTPNGGGGGGTPLPDPWNAKVYVVQAGDYPGLIAQRLTGSATNWPALIRANSHKSVWSVSEKTKPGYQAGNFKTLYAGEKLYLPAGW